MNLDETLAAWAESVRLPDTAAAEIQRRILLTPGPVAFPAALAARPTPAPAPAVTGAPTGERPVVNDPLGPPGGTTLGQPGLDPRWWRRFTVDLTAGLVASTRPAAWAV